MSPSGISKAIKRMETRLGARLVNRTTRSISLTPEGEVYLNHCLQLLNELENAGAALLQARTVVAGRTRILVPRAIGRHTDVALAGDGIAYLPDFLAADGLTILSPR